MPLQKDVEDAANILNDLNDEKVVQQFAKGVMAARGINPEKYNIIIEKADENKSGPILVFILIFQIYGVYLAYKFYGYTGLGTEYFWGVFIPLQLFVYPFFFTLLRKDQLYNICMYVVVLFMVSGGVDFFHSILTWIGIL